MKKFIVGDKVNNQETSEEIIEAENYIKALEILIESANLYCRPLQEIE